MSSSVCELQENNSKKIFLFQYDKGLAALFTSSAVISVTKTNNRNKRVVIVPSGLICALCNDPHISGNTIRFQVNNS